MIVLNSVFVLDSLAYATGEKRIIVQQNDDAAPSDITGGTFIYSDLSAGNKVVYDNLIAMVGTKIVAADIVDSAILVDSTILVIRSHKPTTEEPNAPISINYADLTAGEKTDFDAVITFGEANLSA